MSEMYSGWKYREQRLCNQSCFSYMKKKDYSTSADSLRSKKELPGANEQYIQLHIVALQW